jgi:transposase
LEFSRSSWLAARLPGAEKVVMHRIAAGDVADILGFVARQRARAEARLGAPVRIVSCFEAGPDGFWFHRVLLAGGIENHVVDPTSILVPPGAAGEDRSA